MYTQEQLTELINAYENYINVLSDELDSAISVAHVHHWKSNQVENGKRARKRLDRILNEMKTNG